MDIRVGNNVLSVHGERKLEKEEKEENFQRTERRYASFSRLFTLPNSVDTENVQADYEILTIKLPKRAEAKPKQVMVIHRRRQHLAASLCHKVYRIVP